MGFRKRIAPAAKSLANHHPFLYLNHGRLDLDSIGKCDGAYVGFVNPVPDTLKRTIRESCPSPIRGSASFVDNLLSIETPDDTYNYRLIEAFGTDEDKLGLHEDWPPISQEAADSFTDAVEAWAMELHRLAPLVFFMGPGRTDPHDPWNAWSKSHFTNAFIPFLNALLARNPDLLVETTESYSMDEIKPLGHGYISCLLQEFEPYHQLVVPPAHEARVEELLKIFQL